jgi:hypothetical protein
MSEASSVFWAGFGGAAAAGVFTLAAMLAAEWFRWFLDRPLVNVKAEPGYLIKADGHRDPTKQLLFQASNPHTRPVTLSTFGLGYKDKKLGTLLLNPQFGYSFPYQLDGGKSIVQWATVETLLAVLKKEGQRPSDLGWVYFRSSTGKTFRSKIDDKVIQELEEAFRAQLAV